MTKITIELINRGVADTVKVSRSDLAAGDVRVVDLRRQNSGPQSG